MFCPECGYEYRQGFSRCPDCDVELVRDAPPEDRTEYGDYVQVLDTFNPFDIALIKSLLDSEGIKYFFIGENFGGIYPMATAPRLMVLREQEDEAREILKDLQLTYLASHTYEDEDEEEDDVEDPA